MALHYDYSSVPKALGADGNLTELADNLIWCTMIVNLPAITKDNLQEWYHRLQFYAKVENYKKLASITIQDLEDHIGLTTNASYKTWNEFAKKVVKLWCERNKFKPCNKRHPLTLGDIIR